MARFFDFLFPKRRKPYGGYVLEAEIAGGGMSSIFRAHHPETGKVYALKVLKPESAELMARFRDSFAAEEGTIALKLSHPNVVKTFEFGRGPQDEYYIVMELVDGPNLETLIVVGAERVRECRYELVMQIGNGLRYIHSQGLVHRDFCPKNVLYGTDGVAKIIDFGLTIPANVKTRAAHSRAGTASYMAPEQVRSQPVDARTDIYAYGLSVFEILTGQRPFPVTSDRGRRMQDHLNVTPLSLRDVDPEQSERMESIVRKCIAKDRELRYKSMSEVMTVMRAAVEEARMGRQDTSACDQQGGSNDESPPAC